tara:strand:- start:888 stop:1205 length:318 start_codon:yes stop_codon:yes gene_type:complete
MDNKLKDKLFKKYPEIFSSDIFFIDENKIIIEGDCCNCFETVDKICYALSQLVKKEENIDLNLYENDWDTTLQGEAASFGHLDDTVEEPDEVQEETDLYATYGGD